MSDVWAKEEKKIQNTKKTKIGKQAYFYEGLKSYICLKNWINVRF